MPLKLEMETGDVTLIGKGKPAASTVPVRKFAIEYDLDLCYTLSFDGRHVRVQQNDVTDLFAQVAQHSTVEWKYSKEPEIRSAFDPLNRILQVINSTPAYQLFLAGFQIADTVGVFNLDTVHQVAIVESFHNLVGSLVWSFGKKGSLFFLPEGYVTPEVIPELIANNKLLSINLFSLADEKDSLLENKLCVPYATPIGFNTAVQPETEATWRRINDLVSQ